jgi:hypothetical protein
MLGEASRADANQNYRRQIQRGEFNRADARSLNPQSTEKYMKMQMAPNTWKAVAKSPAALKGKNFSY